MAIETTHATLIEAQTALTMVRAQHNDLTLKIRRREVVDRRRFEAAIFRFTCRVRDQLLTAPTRYAAILAAEHGIPPAALAAALDQVLRRALNDLTAPPAEKP
jgi:hypothetical protein